MAEYDPNNDPRPERPADLRFLGWRLNQDAEAQWQNENALWLQRQLLNQQRAMNPLTVGQASTLLGPETTRGLATEQDYTRGPARMEPSAVPSYQAPLQPGPMQYQQSMMQVPNTLVPPSFDINQLQNPFTPRATKGDLPQDILSRGHNTVPVQTPTGPGPMQVPPPSMRPMEGDMLRPMAGVTPQAPAQFTPQQGPPQSISPMELNTNAPANPAMRSQFEARQHAMSSPLFGRQTGNAALNTLQGKIDAATDYFLALGMDATDARAQAKGLVTGGVRETDLEKHRTNRDTREDEKLAFQKQKHQDYMDLKRQLMQAEKIHRERNGNDAAARLAFQKEKFQKTLEWAMRNESDLTPDMRQKLMEDLTEYSSGIDVGPQERTLFGLPNPFMKPQLGPTTPEQGLESVAPKVSGADEEMAKVQALIEKSGNKDKWEGRTFEKGKYILKGGKLQPNTGR